MKKIIDIPERQIKILEAEANRELKFLKNLVEEIITEHCEGHRAGTSERPMEALINLKKTYSLAAKLLNGMKKNFDPKAFETLRKDLTSRMEQYRHLVRKAKAKEVAE